MSHSKNIVDNLPDLALVSLDLHDELDHYLFTNTEDVRDGLLWWYQRCGTFPCLSCMAQDYLLIPGKPTFHSIYFHTLTI
jgi:hypothetical protein